MESNPLHVMTPELSDGLAKKVLPHMSSEE
jgi:hypothetical protein